MISVWFNKTSHHYLMWANRTDPAAGRLMIWRLFQKDLERSDGSEHTRVQIEHFVMKLRLVQSLEWKQNQLLQFEFVCFREISPAATGSWWSLSSVKLLNTERVSRTTRRVRCSGVWTHRRVCLCHILHFLNFTRQRWSTNVCERVAVFVCWLPFSCSSAKMFVKPMKRLTNIRSWNHNNQKWCRAIRSNWGRRSNWDPLLM